MKLVLNFFVVSAILLGVVWLISCTENEQVQVYPLEPVAMVTSSSFLAITHAQDLQSKGFEVSAGDVTTESDQRVIIVVIEPTNTAMAEYLHSTAIPAMKRDLFQPLNIKNVDMSKVWERRI